MCMGGMGTERGREVEAKERKRLMFAGSLRKKKYHSRGQKILDLRKGKLEVRERDGEVVK